MHNSLAHYENCKKAERFYASALAVYTDSVSPSSVDDQCAVGKFAPRRSVGGDSGRFRAVHGAPGTEKIAESPRALLRVNRVGAASHLSRQPPLPISPTQGRQNPGKRSRPPPRVISQTRGHAVHSWKHPGRLETMAPTRSSRRQQNCLGRHPKTRIMDAKSQEQGPRSRNANGAWHYDVSNEL